MKALDFQDFKPEDRLEFSLDGAFTLQAKLEDALAPFLHALETYADGWMPDVVGGKHLRKYARAAVWTALEEKRGQKSTAIGLYRTKWPPLDMTLRLRFSLPSPSLRVSLRIQPLSMFAEPERCRNFVDMVREWASHHPTPHASAHSMADDNLAGVPYFGRDEDSSWRNGFDKVYEVSWLNVFGPKLVETVGRERVLSTPAHRVEALPDGSILLVTWPTVADFASDEARVAQARAHVHLRPDLDFDTVLRTLRDRSAALAPVEPRFHPDLAPLLARVVDRMATHERQRKIAELNAFQPPVPEEWLPAALPLDVENPERVRSSYADLSESLVAALHTSVPSLFDATPESLTDLDFHFWRENFPERYTRELIDEHTAPAVGAYLGGVLVRRLGGQWLPRQKLEESQVRVGNRVWLPFLRARRYLRSRQSLLDCSLTQFFREVERHRG